MESLSDRLKSLGFKTGSTIQPAVKTVYKPLEEIISADIVSNSMGEFLIRSDLFPYGYQQGKVTFSESIISEKISQAAKLQRTGIPLESMYFLDTETSGLSGGSGTFAFLIGMGTFSTRGFELQQFIIRDPVEESAMLLHLSNLVQPHSVFVTFNGKSFDIPLLSNRLIVNRIPAKFRENAHMDVLHLSRKIWRSQLPSCSLKDLERDVLGMERTDEEVPGWMIPEIYFDYLRTGDAQKLGGVVYHNAQDIVSLAALFIHISDMLEKNSEIETSNPGNLIAVGKIFLETGSIEIARKVFLKCLDLKITRDERIIINSLLGKMSKSEGEFQSAVQYWMEAGNAGSIEACIEMAMYYEHRACDLVSALFWTEKASNFIERSSITPNQRALKKDVEKRATRLQEKVSKLNV